MFALAVGAALAAAFTWGLASLLVNRALSVVPEGTGPAGEPPSPAAVNLYRNLFSLVGFGLLGLWFGEALPTSGICVGLLVSGVLGFALGDVLYFAAFPWCGVQKAAMVSLLAVPLSVLLAWIWLDESLQPRTLVAMGVVLLGVALVVTDRSARSGKGARPLVGLLFALAATGVWATSIVLGHDALRGVGVITGGGLRLVGGILGAVLLAWILGAFGRGRSTRGELARLTTPLRSVAVARLLLFPALCASLINQIPYNFALRELPGGVSALLFATTPLFTLPLGRFFGERFGMRTILGTLIGLAGVAGVVLGSGQEPADGTGSTTSRLEVLPIEGPGEPGLWPRLVADPSGGVHLLWMSPGKGATQLRTSARVDGQWTEPRTLAEGESWFKNWADFPDLALGSDGSLAAWLQKLGSGTFAYGVRVGWPEGEAWLHEDESPVEHGFVTLTPLSGRQVFAVWLDARGTLDEEGELDPTGAMGLYGRSLGFGGERGPEFCLDERVCDCCQTDAALLDDGRVLVVWRDRSEGEVRDIAWSVGDPAKPGSFSQPAVLHPDGWHIPACPVNGPAVSAGATQVSVAWYSAGGGEARVLAVTSPLSAGSQPVFGTPLRLDEGQPQGRVDSCYLSDGSLLVTWLEGRKGQASWCARRVLMDGTLGPTVEIAAVGGDRGDGFLRLVPSEGGALVAFQDAEEGLPRLLQLRLRD